MSEEKKIRIIDTSFTPIHSVGLYVGLGIFIAGTIIAVITTWKSAKKNKINGDSLLFLQFS